MKRLFLFATLSALCATVAKAQDFGDKEQKAQEVIESRIEYLLQSLEESELDLTALFDQLYYYYDHPLNLNTATADELRSLQLMSEEQVSAFMRYRIQYGPMASIYELASVEYLTPQTIQMLLPFVSVSPAEERKQKLRLRSLAKYSRHEFIWRYQRAFPLSEAYQPIDDSTLSAKPNSRYLGSPDRIYARYRYRYSKRVSFGLTGEKDPGEEFFGGTQPKGFDFYSAHLMVTDIGPVRKVLVGDYNLQLGQGVVCWSNFGFRKSPGNTVDVKRFGQGILPMTSVAEANFMRGAATTLGWKKLDLTLAYSNKRVDGTLNTLTDTLTDEASNTFSAFQISGLHRTPGELQKKNTINEEVMTGHFSVNLTHLQLGLTAIQYRFDPALVRDGQLYLSKDFSGTENQNFGFDYTFNLGKFHFYGEQGLSANGGFALFNGVLLPLDQRFRMSLMQRHYTPDYQAVYANSFGERSGVRNESGLYAGVEFLPINRITVQAFYDVYRFPWMSYLVDGPGKGAEFSGQVIFDVSRNLQITGLYRHEQRSRNTFAEGDYFNHIGEETRQRIRLQVTTAVGKQVKLRTRIEGAQYARNEEAPTEGIMLFQDVYWDSKDGKFGVDFRYALFNTDDYNTRIYVYENDMRYIFLVPAYYNRGSRTYINLKYKPTGNITLYLKGGYTFSANEDHFGSGNDEIAGNRKYELKAQAILKF
jgi:hypothetical protein